MKKSLLLIPLILLSACDSLPSWMGGSTVVKRLPGDRKDVLAVDNDLKVDNVLANVTFNLPQASENAAWAQSTGQMTALNSNLKTTGDLTSVQTVAVGEGNTFSRALAVRPVVDGGQLFAMDGAGYISSHDVNAINTRRWVSSALVKEKDHEMMGGGLAADGGKLYAISGFGRVVALDAATGAELWKRELGVPLRSTPRVAQGLLLIITIDSQLFALDSQNGATMWIHRGIGETAGIMNAISPTFAAGTIITPYASGELYGLKLETGDEIWRNSLTQARRTEATDVFSGIGGDPVVDESVVFAVSNSGVLAAFNVLNGQPVWEKKIASMNTPWVTGEYLFVLGEDNQLAALVKYDGRVRWVTQLPRYKDEEHNIYPIVWRGPIMVDGKLVLVSGEGEMKIMDASNGAELSTFSIAEGISTTPIVAAGQLFVVTKDATLYSYQ